MGVNVRSPAISPARARLDQHRESVAAARRKVDDLQRPIKNAQQGLEQAEAEMRQAAGSVAAADELEREALVLAAQSTSGKDPTAPAPGQDRNRAEEKLRVAQHRVGLHRDVLARVRQPHDAALLELASLREGAGGIVADLLIEEYETAARAYDAARDALMRAELTMRSIGAAVATRGRQLGDGGRIDLGRLYFDVASKIGQHLVVLHRYEGPAPRALFSGEAELLCRIAELEA
jgi:chromosome segregation ATPase